MTTKQQGRSKTGSANPFVPLVLDVAVPVGSYYLLKGTFGASAMVALGLSSVVPAVRTVWGAVRERTVNGLAALIVFVNVVGLALGLVAGDPRLMLAKDSAASSAVGIGILVSVALGRPMMTAGVKPFLLKGDPAREGAWERLVVGSPAFRRAERVYSVVWGVVLLVECVVRVVGAYTLPVDTMVWLGSVVLGGAILVGLVVGGAVGAGPMARMVGDEVRRVGGGVGVVKSTLGVGEGVVAAPAVVG
ncbi:hypothetical protein OK074_9099 [Actinobacteria bacterium OK074]|nr:hypothetical protein OK074_9099 [Actinobacteria bacterium OK074]